ncbi:hypothetical protein P43SY_012085 [Pythium insidiosum]|uniref:Uncharacterized protein n=1 Tax=Pythium insidiosum TaxID=114742 RepID=A0AAD5LSB1_PYTIN|nr:hypothetical protein P43SY_012085 [Pythium insidiosum]
MLQLRHPNNYADLQRFSQLKPVRANVTRWSSTYRMLSRYVELRDAIKMVSGVEDIVPRPAAHRQVLQLLAKLKDLDSVCEKLQGENCSMADARVLFDAVIARFPQTASQLKVDARIVHSPVFENAVTRESFRSPFIVGNNARLGDPVDRTRHRPAVPTIG